MAVVFMNHQQGNHTSRTYIPVSLVTTEPSTQMVQWEVLYHLQFTCRKHVYNHSIKPPKLGMKEARNHTHMYTEIRDHSYCELHYQILYIYVYNKVGSRCMKHINAMN